MGEFYKGVNIGVLEDLLYVRREELELACIIDRAGKDLVEYLVPNENFYRFRWPDEDGNEYTAAVNRDMYRALELVMPDLEIPHNQENAHCPADSQTIKIVGEKYDVNGRPYTIFSCGKCGQRFAITERDACLISLCILEKYFKSAMDNSDFIRAGWFMEVSKRIQPKRADFNQVQDMEKGRRLPA